MQAGRSPTRRDSETTKKKERTKASVRGPSAAHGGKASRRRHVTRLIPPRCRRRRRRPQVLQRLGRLPFAFALLPGKLQPRVAPPHVRLGVAGLQAEGVAGVLLGVGPALELEVGGGAVGMHLSGGWREETKRNGTNE